MIDHLELSGDQFYSKSFYYRDDVSVIEERGTWVVSDYEVRQIAMVSEHRTLHATFVVDDDALAIGAFVPIGEDIYRALYDYSGRLDVTMIIGVVGYLAYWVDPVWERDKVDSGCAKRDGDTLILGDDSVFRVYGDGSYGTDDLDDRLWGAAVGPLRMTVTFTRR